MVSRLSTILTRACSSIGNRLVDGMLELGSIRLSDAVVDLDAGTISWGTGEVCAGYFHTPLV